jgi:hypothetical protein
MPERKEFQNITKKIPILFAEQTAETSKNNVTFSEIKEESLALLKPYVGKSVQITILEEQWVNCGPESNEDHSSWKKQLAGKLTQVDKNEIEILIKKGKTRYSPGPILPVIAGGPFKFPFRYYDYNHNQSMEIVKIDTIKTKSTIFFNPNP